MPPPILHHPSPAAAGPAGLADGEVVARVRAGDTALFEILMRRYNQRLFRVVRGILADDHESEDVLQEAWVRSFDALAGFRGESSFATWVTRIAVHEALARARKRRRLVLVDPVGGPFEPSDDAPPTDHAAELRELRLALAQAIDALPTSLRSVFVLREVEQLASAEVAAALGISEQNVRVRLHRAKQQLRRHLDAAVGDEVRRLYLFDGWRCDRLVTAVLGRIGRR